MFEKGEIRRITINESKAEMTKCSQKEYCCVTPNPIRKRQDFCFRIHHQIKLIVGLIFPMIKLIVGLIFLMNPEMETDPTKSNWDYHTKRDVSRCCDPGLLLGSTHRERHLLALRSRLIQSSISFQEPTNLQDKPTDLQEEMTNL